MKHVLIPIVCSLFLIGCSDSTPPPTDEASKPPLTQSTPTEATNAPVVPEAVTPAPSAPSETTAAIDPAALYGQKCASCHGAKAEKAALGKSQVIAGWSEGQVSEALRGYQAGTYGKEMKSLMQGQAKALDNAQIDALARYIAGL
jgi:cytochrome c